MIVRCITSYTFEFEYDDELGLACHLAADAMEKIIPSVRNGPLSDQRVGIEKVGEVTVFQRTTFERIV